MSEIQVSVSILSSDFTKLGEEIKKCEDAGADMIHVDVMDGHFVPNISIGQVIVQAVRSVTKLPIDTHLMIENPWVYIEDFIEKGSDRVSIHAECYGERRAGCRRYGEFPKEIDTIDIERAKTDILRIQNKGAKAFMVLNPGTPMCLDGVLEYLDGVLIMSVHPGFSKQKFIPSVLPKIEELRSKFNKDIAIDGGINELTAPEAVKAGANILATASYFFGSDKPKETVKYLKSLSP